MIKLCLPSALLNEPCKPPPGNMFPVLTGVADMLVVPPVVFIEASTEELAIIFEFPLCDMPGVGIIVPTGEEELTSCGYCWL